MRTIISKLKSMVGTVGKVDVEADVRETTSPPSPEPSALSDYLEYYTSLKAPGYAVLVTGPWGIGKTHQVKEIIPEDQRYYVSLYGLDGVEAINNAVLASCIRGAELGGKLLNTIGDVGTAMGDKYALAGAAGALWTAFLRLKLTPDRTLIFDDLERSPLWTSGDKSTLLGAINHYVEHGNFRVVVICHEELVADKLALLKEKVFGHTVRAEAQTERAISRFICEVPTKEWREFLEGRRNIIREVWNQSGQQSLRILRHVIADIVRIYSILENRHKDNEGAVDVLIRSFAALDIEIRSGGIDAELLKDRYEKYINETFGDNEEGPRPIANITKRYPGADIYGSILSDRLLVDMLVRGVYDKNMLVEWLDQNSHFGAEEVAPWKIVIEFDRVPDSALDDAIKRMNAQFESRRITEMGEFFHVAALRLMMAENGVLPHGVVVEERLCHQYIEDLVTEGRLPPRSLRYDPSDHIFRAYAGISYWNVDKSKELQRVISHWQEAAEASLRKKLPEYGAEILEMMKRNPKDVYRTISPTNYHYDPLSHTPILQYILPEEFVDAWLSLPRGSWKDIGFALDNRYEHDAFQSELAAERSWLLQVANVFDQRIEAADGLNRYRLKRLKPGIFHKVQEEKSANESNG